MFPIGMNEELVTSGDDEVNEQLLCCTYMFVCFVFFLFHILCLVVTAITFSLILFFLLLSSIISSGSSSCVGYAWTHNQMLLNKHDTLAQ